MKLHHETIDVGGYQVGVTRTVPRSMEKLVFLHGFTVNRRLYEPMLERLVKAGYNVTAIDLAGHGGTDSLPAGHSFDDVVQLAMDALFKLGIDRAVFVGHSFGGRIAAEIAARTDMVEKLILMGAAVGQPFDNYENQSVLAKLVSTPLRGLAAVADTLAGAPWGLPGLEYGSQILAAIWSSWPGSIRVGWVVTFGVDTIVALDEIHHKQIPTFIIHGERDLIVPLACAESAADVSGGKLIVVKDAYHSWMIADPKEAVWKIRWALETPWTAKTAV